MADQVVTLTEDTQGQIRRIVWDWLSATGGAVTSATTNRYSGRIIRAVFLSDAGDTAPTNLYDVTIEDADGADILNGGGANITSAATVQKVEADKLCPVSSTTLTLKVTNAGDEKGGTAILYLIPMYG